jgi:hypothetical protein
MHPECGQLESECLALHEGWRATVRRSSFEHDRRSAILVEGLRPTVYRAMLGGIL